VRAEFGYPIMVTPLSQFVGSQAAINVLLGERYKEVTDQVIQYALGFWGEEGSRLMDPNVKDKVLNRPRARELTHWEPPQPSLAEIRRKYGAPGISDEELLSRFFAGPDYVDAMRASGPPRRYPSAHSPLMTLIHELTQRRDCSQVYIRKGDLTLTLGRKEALSTEDPEAPGQ
jgi:oxaloacetate decarboxylase alpha subunit